MRVFWLELLRVSSQLECHTIWSTSADNPSDGILRDIICNSNVGWTGHDDDQFLGHIFFLPTQLDFFQGEFVVEYATFTKESDLLVGHLGRCFNYKGQMGRTVLHK